MKIFDQKQKVVLVLSIFFIIPLGLLTKIYAGPLQNWVNYYLGGVFYEIFFCLVAALLFSAVHPWKIAGGVFLITTLLEFLQLYHPAWLTILRKFWLGQMLLGNTFNAWDFPHYLLGCILGGLWVYGINQCSKH